MNEPARPFTISPEQIFELTRGQKVTFSLEDGCSIELIPPPKPVGKRLTSLAALSSEIMAPVEITLELRPGQFFTFRYHALDSEVSKKCDDIGREVRPPMKQKAGARGIVTDELDFENPEYIEKRGEVNSQRVAFVLINGLVDFEIPGESLAEKNQALRKQLPPRVINALYSAISGLTSDAVVSADFS